MIDPVKTITSAVSYVQSQVDAGQEISLPEVVVGALNGGDAEMKWLEEYLPKFFDVRSPRDWLKRGQELITTAPEEKRDLAFLGLLMFFSFTQGRMSVSLTDLIAETLGACNENN